MIQNLIKEHISKLTVSDVNKFAVENNVHLTEEELNNVYDVIKNNWYQLIYGDSNSIFENKLIICSTFLQSSKEQSFVII